MQLQEMPIIFSFLCQRVIDCITDYPHVAKKGLQHMMCYTLTIT